MLSAVAALVVSLSRRQNDKNCDGSEEWKRRQSINAATERREVRVENDEYEREQQRLAKQIKCVVVLNDHILAFCAIQKQAHILKLFQRDAYALPSFSNIVVAHAILVPKLVHAPPVFFTISHARIRVSTASHTRIHISTASHVRCV